MTKVKRRFINDDKLSLLYKTNPKLQYYYPYPLSITIVLVYNTLIDNTELYLYDFSNYDKKYIAFKKGN
jgi:hypothetical protein